MVEFKGSNEFKYSRILQKSNWLYLFLFLLTHPNSDLILELKNGKKFGRNQNQTHNKFSEKEPTTDFNNQKYNLLFK